MTLNTAIRGVQIEDVSISGAHLVATNSPTDGQVLTWNTSEMKFEWDDVGTMIFNEAPTGDINGVNDTYTLTYQPLTDSEMVYLNGLLQEPGAVNDYEVNVSGSEIIFVVPPETGDIILVSYLTSQGLGGGGADHGELGGLADDDHTQYILVDGTRPFTSTVGGITPSADAHLTTKLYVDNAITTATGALSLGISNVVEDTTPQLGGDLDLNQHYLQLDPTPTSDDTGNGLMASVTVDTNASGIAAPLYMASDGNYDLADASVAATMPCSALALEAGTGTKKVLKLGYMRNDGWNWTPGGLVYVSTDAGGLTQTAPAGTGDQVQIVGHAVTADILYFNPQYALVEVA